MSANEPSWIWRGTFRSNIKTAKFKYERIIMLRLRIYACLVTGKWQQLKGIPFLKWNALNAELFFTLSDEWWLIYCCKRHPGNCRYNLWNKIRSGRDTVKKFFTCKKKNQTPAVGIHFTCVKRVSEILVTAPISYHISKFFNFKEYLNSVTQILKNECAYNELFITQTLF